MFEYILLVILLIVCLSMHYALNDLREKVFRLRQSMEERFAGTPQSDAEPARPKPAPAPRTAAATPPEATVATAAPTPEKRPADLTAAESSVLRENPAGPATTPEPPTTSQPNATAVRPAVPPHPADATVRSSRPTAPATAAPTGKRPRKNLEKYIGTQLFAAIGIGVLILGVGFFIQYAINNDWLDETMRTVLGFVCGGVLLGLAASLRNRYRSFSSVLAGGAFAVFYVTVAIAYHYYALFPQSVTFGLLVLVTVFTAAIAAGYDRRELAVVALTGGFAAPFLASSGQGSHIMLFLYLAILDCGMSALAFRKKWWELPVVTFAATWFVLYLFVRHAFPGPTADGTAPDSVLARDLFLFAVLFYLLFASATAAVLRAQNSRFYRILAATTALNHFVFLRFGLLFLGAMAPDRSLDGIVPLAIAAVNAGTLLAVRRRLREAPGFERLLLSLAVLFLTLAAPLQFGAQHSLLCWAAEIVLLLWFYARTRQPVYEVAAALLCPAALVMTGALWFRADSSGIFAGSGFLTALCVVAAFAYAAWFTDRKRAIFARARLLRHPFGNVSLMLAAGLLCYGTFVAEFVRHLTGDLLIQAWLLCTLTVAAALLGALRRPLPIAGHSWIFIVGGTLAVCAFLLLSAPDTAQPLSVMLSWISTVVTALMLAGIAFDFYRHVSDERHRRAFLVWLNMAAACVWIAALCHLLSQLGVHRSFSTGFSLALTTAAALQTGLGMYRRQKTLRLFALAGFAVVLVKLLVHDLWQWPTLGRVVIFIALGIILLSLSFLYQRLRPVLFKNDEPLPEEKK